MLPIHLKKNAAIPLLSAFFFFLIVCPLATIFIKTIIINDRLDFSYTAATIMESQNAAMILNSLLLGLLVVITSTLLSIPLAYLFSRTTFARYQIFDVLFLIPFMTPPYIASMGWILFMQKRGLLEQIFPSLSGGVDSFFSLTGLILVMSLHVFPFMLTILKNAMTRIPSSMEESAAVLGAGFFRRMCRVFLPLLTGNYVIGALLVFVKTLSEYGTPYTLGRRIGFEVFTTNIHRYAAVAPVSFGKAAVLASVLVSICLLLWIAQNYVTTHHSYQLISGRGCRLSLKDLSVPAKLGSWLYIGIILIIAVGIPYFSVIMTSLIKLRGFGLTAGNFTLQHYTALFTDTEDALSAMGNSLLLAVAAATICAFLGTLVVLTLRSCHRKSGRPLEAVSLLPEMLPGIVMVIGIMLFWNDIYGILPLYNTFGILIVTYVVLFLPFTIQYVTSSFTQINNSLMAAGQVFGGTPIYIFRRITFPLIAKGIAAGWMITFIISLRELVAPSLMAPPNTLVVSTYIMREFEQGSVSLGMSMAVLCVAFTVAALLFLTRYVRRLPK